MADGDLAEQFSLKPARRHRELLSALGLVVGAAPALAADGPAPGARAADCAASQLAAPIAEASLAAKRVPDVGCDWAAVTDLDTGYAVQADVLARLDAHLVRVGYKVSGTSADARAAMGVYYPIVSVLHRRALRRSGRGLRLPPASAAVVEPDLLVRVSDERINEARSIEEVIACIDQIIPFAEVPLWIAPKALGRNGGVWAAINGAAGYGFVGKPLVITGARRAAVLKSLGAMSVRMTDRDGRPVGGGSSADIFGNPLYSALELNNEFLARRARLKKGDYISLGNFGKPSHPRPGDRFTVTYSGIDGGDIAVVAAFR